MSERIVDSPDQHGWIEEDGKWVWDGKSAGSIVDGNNVGEVTTWDGGEWTPDSSLIIDATGNATFTGNLTLDRPGVNGANITYTASTGSFQTGVNSVGDFFVYDAENSAERLSINQAGDATFSGTVSANKILSGFWLKNDGTEGLFLGSSTVYPANGAGAVNGAISLGDSNYRFNNAYFSGAVMSDTVQSNSINSSVDGRAGLTFGGSNAILPSNKDATTNAQADLGRDGNRFKDAYFSGTVDAAGFTINGSPISGGGGGFPDGDFTHNGTITATDFIATSDERVKENITTAPVGIIDSLKGREWEWKETGEKGSGVVAQELEKVLPHLVHTDDDGMKSVSYMGLCAYLIEEVKSLKAEVEALK